MKIKVLSTLFVFFVLCFNILAQQKTQPFAGAPPNFKPQSALSTEKQNSTFSFAQQVSADSFETTVYTFGDLVVFSYFNDTQVKIYNQSGSLTAEQTLVADTIYNVSPGSGIYRIVANKSFTILVGDAINNYVNGYFAVDEAGKGVSLKLNTWMMRQFNASQDEFVIFGYEDNTGFTVKNLKTNDIIYAGTIDKGKYFSFRQAGLLSSIYSTALQVNGTKPISALSYTDQDYYVPSANGTFTGTEFYGYSAYEGGWTNSITVTSYADNNFFTIKNIDDGSVIDTATLMRGQVYTKGIYAPTYWAVTSQGPLTTANIPYAGWSGSYYYMTRAIDETGTGAGKLFFVPTIASKIHVFSFDNQNTVKITRLGLNTEYPYPSATEIYNSTLNYGEVYNFSSDYGNYVYKIEGSGNVSVLQSNGGAGADFMPLSYAAKLPDLTLSVDDIHFSIPDSLYVPGDKITVHVTIHNTSAVDAMNIPVVGYDGDPDAGNAVPIANDVLPLIKAGETGLFVFDYIIPIRPEFHSLVIKIDPNNYVVESNKSNNRAQRFLRSNKDLLPPLAVNVTAPSALTVENGNLFPNPFYVRYDIFNTGSVSASNVAVTLDLKNGLSLENGLMVVQLGNIPAKGSASATFFVRANPDSTGFNVFTATITADNADTKFVYRAIMVPDNVPPAAPKNFAGNSIGNASATFTWTKNIEPDFGGYQLFYSLDSTIWNGIGANQGNSPLLVLDRNNYLVTGLPLINDAPTNYFFKLKAFDQSLNLSGDSNILQLLITKTFVNDSLLDKPVITKIFDVPNDNGRHVFVTWSASKNDGLKNNPIAKYSIWRLDKDLWTFAVEVPAISQVDYSAIAVTIFDSTKTEGLFLSTFKVIAHGMNPILIAASDPASGYSLDNLAPRVPTSFAVALQGSNAALNWEKNVDPDLQYYAVYRSTLPNFTISSDNRITRVADNAFIDATVENGNTYYYKITAIDYSGNESGTTNEAVLMITDVADGTGIPTEFNLYQNYPNPFNPSTTISFDLPNSEFVSLTIYDVLGKQVASMVNEYKNAGRYSIRFDADRLSSGMYFYKISAGNFNQIKKFILMK
ncbi:MAG: T9SS type A sorting domain-containing protein [Ignavibacteria bacterium]|nr:T9SS type A sorting domain-containing protein [Ignavibacteria bacterium]